MNKNIFEYKPINRDSSLGIFKHQKSVLVSDNPLHNLHRTKLTVQCRKQIIQHFSALCELTSKTNLLERKKYYSLIEDVLITCSQHSKKNFSIVSWMVARRIKKFKITKMSKQKDFHEFEFFIVLKMKQFGIPKLTHQKIQSFLQ